MSPNFHVICTLPNASHNISGVPFRDHDKPGAVITAEPVAAEVAGRFKGIPGYTIIDAGDPAGDGAKKAAPGRRPGNKGKGALAGDAGVDASAGDAAPDEDADAGDPAGDGANA